MFAGMLERDRTCAATGICQVARHLGVRQHNPLRGVGGFQSFGSVRREGRGWSPSLSLSPCAYAVMSGNVAVVVPVCDVDS